MAEVNTEFFENKRKQVESLVNCEDLELMGIDIQDIFTDLFASIEAQIQPLIPVIELPSFDPTEILDWIQGVIDVFKKPYDDLIAMQALYLLELQKLLASLALKNSELECDIQPPTPPNMPDAPEAPSIPTP